MRRVLIALLALGLAACGTTVPLTTQSSALGGGDGLGAPVASAAPTSAGLDPTGGTTGSAAGPVGGSGPVLTTTTTTGTGPSGARPTVAGGTLAPATGSQGAVEIGVFAVKDLGPATQALGFNGLSTGNGTVQAKAAVALLNARGGLAGHKVTPVIVEQDPTRDAATQYQAACSDFFDDHHVRAIVAWGLIPQLQSCAQQHGVPYVTSGNRTTSRAVLNRFPAIAVGSQLVLERMVQPWIGSLRAQHWFAPTSPTEKVAVGLIYNDDSDFAGVPSLVRAALRAQGLTLGPTQSMPGVDDSSKAPAASSAGGNAALKFASQGVNRVLVVDKSGQAISYFGLAAASQGYYPLYGLTSLELPSALRTVLSARQLQGAAGIGWLPSTDVPATKQPALSANASACVKAMSGAQQDMTAAATRQSALALCDGVLLLGAAWRDPRLALSTFVSGLHDLGTTYRAVTALTDDFTGHVDGASGFRPLAYQSACDCFAYTAALEHAP